MPPIPPASAAPAARAVLGAALALLGGAWQAALAQSVEVTAGEPGRVSIRAGGASAAEVAEALTARTGISVVVTGDASTPIDVDIVDEPLEKAVAHLAPNHLLMRGDRAADASITEIVLMMPDGDDGGVESTEFLPTGEPTDGVVTDDAGYAEGGGELDENGQPIDGGLEVLRDPDRAAAVRAAAASAVAAQAAAQAAELAGGQDGFVDDGSGIDPATGLPLVDGVPVDDGGAAYEEAIDPATGLPFEDAGQQQ